MNNHRQVALIDIEEFYDPLLMSDEPIEIDWDYVQHSLKEAEAIIQTIKRELT